MLSLKRTKILALIMLLGIGFLGVVLLLPAIRYEASLNLSSSRSSHFRLEIETP